MNPREDAELHRLCSELEQIDRQFPLSGFQREALKKAAIGLQLAFLSRKADQVEDWYTDTGRPLSADQRLPLISLGLDPDLYDTAGGT